MDLRTDFKSHACIPKAIAVGLVLILVLSILSMVLPKILKNASAGSVTHSISNIDFQLTDYGRIIGEYITWKGVRQTCDLKADLTSIGWGSIDEDSWLGVFAAHDGYDLTTPNIADSFAPGNVADDFRVTASDSPIYWVENAPEEQMSYATYTNTGVLTGDPNDIRITEKSWSLKDEDWVIFEYTITNIKTVPITGLNFGFFGYMSGEDWAGGAPYDFLGIGGDGGDDRDQWDALNAVYTVEDNNGIGTTIAFSSADAFSPLNIYHGNDYRPNDLTDPLVRTGIPSDTLLLNAIRNPAQLAHPTCPPPAPCSTRSVVGWNVSNMIGALPPGGSIKLPLVIAFGITPANAKSQVSNARDYYSDRYYSYKITEIQDAGMPRIEIYNMNRPTAALGIGGFMLSPDMCANQWSAGTWSSATIASGEHQFYTLGGSEAFPSLEGGTISLCDAGLPIASISYGQNGLPPDPVTGESVSRIYRIGIGEYLNDWTRDPTPTFGALNDVPPINYNPEVVLNEVYYNPANPGEKFIELYYNGSSSLDIAGWQIVGDDIYTIPSGTDSILDTKRRYYHLAEPEDQPLFDGLAVGGDNVYLYDDSSTPVLQDMVGWSTAHFAGYSMTRIPDGYGTFNGYDDVTSEAAGWFFDQIPTYTIVTIVRDKSDWGDPGYFVLYQLVVTNLQFDDDYIDITYQSENGWLVEFYNSDISKLLPDNDGDAIPDTGLLAPLEERMFWAKVYVPPTPTASTENTTVLAQASLDPFGRDSAHLKTLVNPWIEPEVYIEPSEPTTIYEKSGGLIGLTNETKITLKTTGTGFLQYTGQDVVFVIDSSGSMEDNDPDPDWIPCDIPMPLRVAAAWNYVDSLIADDRGAYVDFDTVASLRVPLTNDFDYLKEGPVGLWCSDQLGGTLFTPALSVANDELIYFGDATRVKVMIFLTDGESNVVPADYNSGLQEAQRAADNGIMIFSIGLNVDDPLATSFLSDIAKITGGAFFTVPDPSTLSAIFDQILDIVRNIAGYNPTIGNPDELMIKFVLDQGIDCIDGTFELVPGTIETNPVPDVIQTNPTNTTLIWHWPSDQIRVFDYWAVKFDISSTVVGSAVPADKVPDSAVTYRTPNWFKMKRPFPLLNIEVLEVVGLPVPYINNVQISGNDVTITWQVPSTKGVDYYEIYGGPDQTALDFGTVIDTIMPPILSWTDTNALADRSAEFYYTVVAVNDTGPIITKSSTSNTAGYYTMAFNPEIDTFSLPLLPFGHVSLEDLMNDMDADSISWLDAGDNWQTYPSSPAPNAKLGEGYMIISPNPSHSFTGQPGSMIMYRGTYSWDFPAGSLVTAAVASTNIELAWPTLGSDIQYYVYRSTERDGFFKDAYTKFGPVPGATYVDVGAASAAGEYYYLVVPYNMSTSEFGASTYSIGIFTAEYNGNEMFGLPLEPVWGAKSADWYVDQIPNCLGMVFLENGIWKAHFKEFEEGVYDTTIEYGRGYELTAFAASLFSIVGW